LILGGILEKLTSNEVGLTSRFFEKRIGGEWLSTTDAAAFLGISQNALRILVCRRKVKFYKLGRRLRFQEIDLKQLLQKEF
jgi:excisionase family DNA binding protein